jgi:iron complex outermembrane receptor protein
VPAYQVTISDQRATGVDLEARWQATNALRFYGGAEFITQRFRHHVANSGVDLSGQPVGTPLWTATLGSDVRFSCWPGQPRRFAAGRVHGATRCNDDSVAQGTCLTTPSFRSAARARASMRSPRLGPTPPAFPARPGAWRCSSTTRPTSVRHGINYVAAALGSPYGTICAPRWFGLELHASLWTVAWPPGFIPGASPPRAYQIEGALRETAAARRSGTASVSAPGRIARGDAAEVRLRPLPPRR